MYEKTLNQNASPIDMFRAMQCHKVMQRFVEGVQIEPADSLDFCVRPSSELGDKQSKVYKEFGYGREAAAVVPRSGLFFAQTTIESSIMYGSTNGYENRSHRFIFSKDSMSYHREPFDIDLQSIGSRTLNLSGLNAIASDRLALIELRWLAGVLTNVDASTWSKSRIATVFC